MNASRSIPSATTRRPRACPRSMMERTMSSSRPPVSSLLEARGEGAVQLELADGQVVQVRDGGEARPEVVDGDPDARIRQALDDPLGAGDVGHDHPLGDFENQSVGRKPGLVEQMRPLARGRDESKRSVASRLTATAAR